VHCGGDDGIERSRRRWEMKIEKWVTRRRLCVLCFLYWLVVAGCCGLLRLLRGDVLRGSFVVFKTGQMLLLP
jgi:hypothetical protein